MKIYCLYNEELHIFFNKVVEIILRDYSHKLNIASLNEIELVDKNNLSYVSDAKIISINKFIVSSRLYELLPSYDVLSLQENIDYKTIRQTIYHEMGHINDMTIMPSLYAYGMSEENGKAQIVSRFWLEYIAEERSNGFEGLYKPQLCNQFVQEKWECNSYSICENFNSSNFAYLVKVLPYFMSATSRNNMREHYLELMNNELLLCFISELDIEIRKLEKLDMFDDVTLLYSLYNIICKYYKEFTSAYTIK